MDRITDTRRRPQISTSTAMRAVAVMFLSRLGSLNALGASRSSRFWSGWLGGAMPSSDTLGRICSLVRPEGVRQLQQELYARLKRQKAVNPPSHGLMALILDGHETHATFRRHCPGCLERTIHTRRGTAGSCTSFTPGQLRKMVVMSQVHEHRGDAASSGHPLPILHS